MAARSIWWQLGSSGECISVPDPFPELLQTPDATNARSLLPPTDALAPLSNFSFPDSTDPASEPVFQTLPFDGPALGHKPRSDGYDGHAWYAFPGQDAALNESLGGRTDSETPLESYGYEGAPEPP